MIAVNFLFSRLKDFSCTTQRILTENVLMRHAFNLLAVFFLLIIFSKDQTFHPFTLIILTLCIACFFIMMSRCDFRFIVVFFMIVATIFYIQADKNYRRSQKTIHDEDIAKITKLQLYLEVLCVIIVFVGSIVYLGQHVNEYKQDWKWSKFLFGVVKCVGNGTQSHSIMRDFMTGLIFIFSHKSIKIK